jgi:hypothetical protein
MCCSRFLTLGFSMTTLTILTPGTSSALAAYYPAAMLRDLWADYKDIPFRGICGFSLGWESEIVVNNERVAMATAALLHFNGSLADLVRWIGGPHVAAHRDHPSILGTLQSAGVDAHVVSGLQQIFLSGIPATCQAVSKEDNFNTYYRYGNHSTVSDAPEKAYDAMVKDNRKGFTLLFDQRAVLFILHCHLTPQGLVDVDTPYKKPRTIFDSSYRPFPWCSAINDWTHKDNEPPLTFAGAEMGFMVWLYNLRITYPNLEIYIADDDISGAFRLMRYHPNCIAMHTVAHNRTKVDTVQCVWCIGVGWIVFVVCLNIRPKRNGQVLLEVNGLACKYGVRRVVCRNPTLGWEHVEGGPSNLGTFRCHLLRHHFE